MSGKFVKGIIFIFIFELFKRLKVQKMASVQFRLRSKAIKNLPIKVRLVDGKVLDIELNTGFLIHPKDWSKETDRPKQNNTENKLIFNNLKKLESFIYENLNKDLGNGILIDKYWLNTQINNCFNRVEKVDAGLVINHIQYILDNANTRKIKGRTKLGLSVSRVKGYETFKTLFKKYETFTKKQYHFLDINKTFVEKFTNWLINTQKYSVNYSGKQIDNLKTVGLDAHKNEIQVNPFIEKIEGFTESNEDRFIVTLSFEELETIRTAEIENKAYQNARNWLLLGCEIGQRGGDLINLTTENIRYNAGNTYIDLIQQKTKKSVTVPVITPHVKDIIENNFPYKISTQKLNFYIKKVCEIAKIDEVIEGKKMNPKAKKENPETIRKILGFYPKYELITTHSFRRSFATNYYKKIPTAILIGITGHSKESLFLSYINASEDKDANADLFMKFYNEIHKKKEPELKVVRNAN